MGNDHILIVAENRKAHYDYFLLDFYEAGMELVGTEVKSIRNHSVSIKDSYVVIRNHEAFVLNMHIAIYKEGNIFNHDEYRNRKLLLHKKEIYKLEKVIKEQGYTLIPTKIYFKGGRVKLEFAICKGKKLYDKRETEKEKSIQKEIRKGSKEIY